MKTVTIPAEQEFLFDLLKKAEEESLILQTESGQQFVLLSLADWQGFDVGESGNFEEEVKRTSENDALLAFLAQRKRDEERVPMKDVKELLGLQ